MPQCDWRVRGLMLVWIGFTLLVTGFVWIVPIEVFQQWAFDRAGQGQFERFEAVGSAEFSVWLSRIACLAAIFVSGIVWWNLDRWANFAAETWAGLRAVTLSSSASNNSTSRSLVGRLRTLGGRALLIVWGVLFVVHFANGIRERIHEWPYFRFNSGDVVLPNISDSNRAVIRYLREATPENARILVASDQKLFFLSYYLRPRVLLHRMHPESEHVIPLKDQERKLNAYRLEDLSPHDLEQMPHDYTLEYFEHPDFVERGRLLEDRGWIEFMRRREQNPTLIPPYVVRLRPVEGTRP
ncbi:hypothetical protein [Schlesneria paludicola]|uniref:hypothetical protein n=1 Tax=Schlesneria paludicola TaxID=360056 RepID=UPI0012F79055|nr:hypothetical protein [Schlesneria paludicola]